MRYKTWIFPELSHLTDKKRKSKEYCLFFLQSQKVKKNCYHAWLPTICFQLSRHILEGGHWLNFSLAHLTAAPTTLHARQAEGRARPGRQEHRVRSLRAEGQHPEDLDSKLNMLLNLCVPLCSSQP